VTQNGILLMGLAAMVLMLCSRGSVALLVVLYSINVFITFTLSQLGMVRHWWRQRRAGRAWRRRILVNGIGLVLTTFILISLSLVKFWEGGWITLLVTGLLVGAAFLIRRHYDLSRQDLRRLDDLVETVDLEEKTAANRPSVPPPACDPAAKTAVVLVNGFNGLGLHTLFGVLRLFPGLFRNFVFLQVGVVDAGNFKGAAEVENLRQHVAAGNQRYVDYLRRQGIYAEAVATVAHDVVGAAAELAPTILKRFPQAIFFGGQLVFRHETFMTRILHNYVIFAVQRRFYEQGLPVLILPIRV
jgi:K+ transporter